MSSSIRCRFEGRSPFKLASLAGGAACQNDSTSRYIGRDLGKFELLEVERNLVIFESICGDNEACDDIQRTEGDSRGSSSTVYIRSWTH